VTEPIKFPRSFPGDFQCVLTHLQQTYPHQWPAEELDALTEEAKQVARQDRENAIEFYAACAARIRESGWHC
jgi:hypothetical protein